jgi:isopenicillin N synthase-like dioxygenase
LSKTLPVIDVSDLSDERALPRLAAEIGAACRDVGFFYVTNHSVPKPLMEAAFAQSRQLFALPLAEKRRIAMEVVGGNRGYSALMREILDHAVGPDMKEAFNVGLDLPPDDSEILAGKPFRALNAWPDMAGFRDTMLAYFDACTALGLSLHRAFAADLGVKLDYFDDKFDRSTAIVRLLHYPIASAAEQVGAGAHTDYGNITLLATDDVGGLEVRDRSGAWIEATPMPGAFIVNIGDCLMRWTNDVYVSTPHRVFNRSGRERYSIAFFFDPNPEAAVVAIPSCVAAGESPRYAPVQAGDYLTYRLEASVPA